MVERSPLDGDVEDLAFRLWALVGMGNPDPLLDDAAAHIARQIVRKGIDVVGAVGQPGKAEETRDTGNDEQAGRDRRDERIADALRYAALVHWYRYLLLPKGRCETDLIALRVVLDALNEGPIEPFSASMSLRYTVRPDEPPRTVPIDAVDAAVRWAEQACRTFETSGSPNDLDEAERHLRVQMAVLYRDERLPALQSALATLAVTRFLSDTSKLSYADEAIALQRRVVEVVDPGDARRSEALSRLGRLLEHRCLATGSATQMVEAIDVLRTAAESTDEDLPEYGERLFHLGDLLFRQAEAADDDTTLEEAVTVLRASFAAENTPERASVLMSALCRRAHRDPGVTDEAVEEIGPLLAALAGHSHEAVHCANFGNLLLERFRTYGSPADLHRSVETLREAVTRAASDRQAECQMSLSRALRTRFEYGGRPNDLDEAVVLARESLATPASATTLGDRETNLATALLLRYEHSGAPSDLAEGTTLLEQVVRRTTPDDPQRPSRVSALAVARAWRASAGDRAALTDTIALHREAIAASTQHDEHTGYLSNLGAFLTQEGGVTHLDEAVRALEEVVARTAPDHPHRLVRWSNYAAALHKRAVQRGNTADLNEAIKAHREACTAAPQDHPDRAMLLTNLSDSLLERHRRTGHTLDRDEAADLLGQAAEHRAAPVRLRIASALALGRLAAQEADSATALRGFGTAVRLLPVLAWRGLDRGDQEQLLGGHRSVIQDAAAWAIAADDPEQAVELLEHGRYVLWNQGLETRADLARLRLADPALHERLVHLQTVLTAHGASPRTPGTRRGPDDERKISLLREWDTLVARAGEVAGPARFATAPTFDDLREACGAVPVVLVNVSTYRCDALIVSDMGVRTVPLPDTTAAEVADRAYSFLGALMRLDQRPPLGEKAELLDLIRRTLDWLWTTIARPVLKALGFTGAPAAADTPPRLRWSPTGLLSLLPLHAAADYDGMPGAQVMDRVVSSYTGSLRALLRADRGARPMTDAAGPLVVAVPVSGNREPLTHVEAELRAIVRHSHAPPEVLRGPEASRENVRRAMRRHSVVHFACHGWQDPTDPSTGHVCLHDGNVHVSEIADETWGSAELVVVSACRTGTGGVDLPDEALHLSAGLQLAGCRHVIGTLWSVRDDSSAELAELFYASLNDGGRLDPDRSALALHCAIRQLRDRDPYDPTRWAFYFHTGP